ncbi:MAG: hypothetical protein NBV67_13450 [Tagaea sp.]|nr:hypothetical protein [Tagaea sp.]
MLISSTIYLVTVELEIGGQVTAELLHGVDKGHAVRELDIARRDARTREVKAGAYQRRTPQGRQNAAAPGRGLGNALGDVAPQAFGVGAVLGQAPRQFLDQIAISVAPEHFGANQASRAQSHSTFP